MRAWGCFEKGSPATPLRVGTKKPPVFGGRLEAKPDRPDYGAYVIVRAIATPEMVIATPCV